MFPPPTGANDCSEPAPGSVGKCREVLAVSTAASPWLVRGGWRRILLIDGTHFTCPGPLGMVWRVHTAFDPAFWSAHPTEA